ncbi:MAG: hypothetical protein KIT69_16890, partial [Propionibacteriaceae bacterium]|nr:hypothetical protein [Propionibacteriaceae bacterium]
MSLLSDWLRRGRETQGRARDEGRPRDPRLRGDDGGEVAAPSSVVPAHSSVVPPSSPFVIPAKVGISGDAARAVIFQASALLLAYPEEELLTRLDTIEAALTGTGAEELFAPVLSHLGGTGLSRLQSFHIQEFDLSRRHALHLSYWTDGDTRRRGEVLA